MFDHSTTIYGNDFDGADVDESNQFCCSAMFSMASPPANKHKLNSTIDLNNNVIIPPKKNLFIINHFILVGKGYISYRTQQKSIVDR